jgi:type II secretory pathway component GspD/PulD (secretin)
MIYRIIITGLLVMMLVSVAGGNPLELDKKVSLQFDNAPLASVLTLISQQYNINIVQSGVGDQKVTVKLEDVALVDALKAILNSNGFNYYFSGDIVVVKPMEQSAVGETVAQTITLNYISPAAVMNATADMLSPKGKMKIIEDPGLAGKQSSGPHATQVVIVDLPEVVDQVVAFVRNIDQPEQQVAIEVKMIEVNVNKDTKTGLTWPTSLTTRLSGITTDAVSSSATEKAPQALGQIQLPDGKWEWGKLSVNEVSVVLDFLEQSGNSKLISDPRITTLNNHEAEIKVTTVIPIQTINRFSEGGAVQDIVTYQDEEVGISLLVTPHITDGDRIVLDVLPTVAEIIGYTGPEGNQKPITSERSVKTKIEVKNGETAVLGGLLKENKIENQQKVFFLGSIPIIGGLFRHKTVQTSTTDLMILITPTLIGL